MVSRVKKTPPQEANQPVVLSPTRPHYLHIFRTELDNEISQSDSMSGPRVAARSQCASPPPGSGALDALGLDDPELARQNVLENRVGPQVVPTRGVIVVGKPPSMLGVVVPDDDHLDRESKTGLDDPEPDLDHVDRSR